MGDKVAREWAAERVQWGRPIGKHDAVAQKLAFIAGSAFGLEAMLDVAARLADDKRNDIRIEAALCKVYGSELSWQVIDELMQVRGGRGYETAASLKARGEKPVPVEQVYAGHAREPHLRGSSEIMHLLIAREAVDTHLQAAGGLLMGDGDVKAKADAAMKAGLFYGKWLPQLAVGKGQNPRSYEEFGPLGDLPALRRARVAQAARDGRSTAWRAGRQSSRRSRRSSGASSTSAPSCSRSPRPVVYADTLGREHPERKDEAIELAQLFCSMARRRADTLFGRTVGQRRRRPLRAAQKVLDGRYAWLEEGSSTPPARVR